MLADRLCGVMQVLGRFITPAYKNLGSVDTYSADKWANKVTWIEMRSEKVRFTI